MIIGISEFVINQATVIRPYVGIPILLTGHSNCKIPSGQGQTSIIFLQKQLSVTRLALSDLF